MQAFDAVLSKLYDDCLNKMILTNQKIMLKCQSCSITSICYSGRIAFICNNLFQLNCSGLIILSTPLHNLILAIFKIELVDLNQRSKLNIISRKLFIVIRYTFRIAGDGSIMIGIIVKPRC